MLPKRLRCFCPDPDVGVESGACTFMWQTNSTEKFPFSRKIGQNGNKVCVSFTSFSYAEFRKRVLTPKNIPTPFTDMHR